MSSNQETLAATTQIVTNHEDYLAIAENTRTTLPYITKYEKTRVFSVRAQQLANGAPAMVAHSFDNVRDIVKEEWKQKKIPFIVRRYTPNGKYEDWKVHELSEL